MKTKKDNNSVEILIAEDSPGQAVQINNELKQREQELTHANEVLNGLYRIADGLNQAGSEREVVEMALERALELPGIQAGWISLREGESGFRLAGAHNLPPALDAPGALEGDCTCRRRLVSGELDHVTNIMECERLGRATGDTHGLRYHASVPLSLGERTLGVMNLVGPKKGLFNEDKLKILYSVGNQVAVALERAHLHEHLEQLVKEKTATLAVETAERKLAQDALAESELRFRQIAENIREVFFLTEQDSNKTLYVSPAFDEIFGCSRESQYADPLFWAESIHPDDRKRVFADYGHQMETGEFDNTLRIMRPDGAVRWVRARGFPIHDDTRKLQRIAGIVDDVTESKLQEEKIARLTRIYAVLSGINTTIVRTRDRLELFGQACGIAVEQGKFRFAWIGVLDANGQEVTPVARAGVDEGYLDSIQLTAREDAPNRCEMVARALREKTVVVCNDIDTDPQMARWREEALRRGYRSVAIFPLQLADKVAGLLLLYASEVGFFDTEEMRLLSEIAGDISFALDHLDKQERLCMAEEQFRGLVEQAIAGIYILQDDKVAYVNPRFVEIFGYASADELIGRDSISLIAEKDRSAVLDKRRRVEGEVSSLSYGFTALRKDGSMIEVGVHSNRATHQGRPAIIGMLQDVSEKKRAEEEIKRYVEQLESAFMSTVEVATTLSEMRDPYTAGHERRVAALAVAIGAELGFDASRQEGLRVAGHLHDIGKMTIPAEILSKPGKLSAIEFQLIQGHAQASYDVLKGVKFPWPVAEVALQHHERIDGSGYPQRLKGEAILLEARIMAVADVVEAMSSHRPFRAGRGIEAALQEIERGRGSAYDAEVADAALRLFRERLYQLAA